MLVDCAVGLSGVVGHKLLIVVHCSFHRGFVATGVKVLLYWEWGTGDLPTKVLLGVVPVL